MDSNDVARIIQEFERARPVHDSFRSTCQELLTKLLRAEGIVFHSVTSRVKATESLIEKLGRAGKDYHELTEITDLVGIRIITNFEDDVNAVGSIVEREFTIDPRSIDKRKILDPDRFGYLSLHYICRLNDHRSQLPENSQYQQLLCEIQIRSILQHAWAEIEHDLGYGSAIPAPIRRRFSRLAGLLEIADREFSQIKMELGAYTSTVKHDIATAPSSVNIDKISLGSFIETDHTVEALDKEMAAIVRATLHASSDISPLVEQLRFVDLRTIEELKHSLEANRELILRQWKIRMNNVSRTHASVIRGISLFHLFEVLLAQSGRIANVLAALDRFEIGAAHSRLHIAESIMAAVMGPLHSPLRKSHTVSE